MTDHPTLEALLNNRFSCRAFLPEPLPAHTVQQMFGLAQRTASWCNSQAWSVVLTSGTDTDAFAKALTYWATTHPPKPDIAPPSRYEGVYQERRRGAGLGLYGALGIERDDHEGRSRQMLENFRFFGAPHVAVVSSPTALGPYGSIDCGAYVSTLLLAAESLGVAAIAQAAIAMHSDFVHEYLEIPDDRDIVCAVSFGYADERHPANGFRTDRADLTTVIEGLP